ncbi:SPW repeat protein [Pontibacter sp. KCTC 32443]|uniref:SPW repeat protein n=1 Tax=Pontibacter TaxID=323449 RepID=UPI00164EC45A|nr:MULTISPECIES: SPW repeat protein [Pontibacter]MBC5772592.1 SPW repeat protein [Pontibacter sp. KCTC 32443]
MRFIPTRFHGILDYIVGIFMIIAPWVLDFSDNDAATWTMVIAGILVLAQTVMTDFEVGLIRRIPMQSHLMVDFGLGVLLALSPWLFGFADRIYSPHLILGVFSILASLTTHRVPSTSYRRAHTSPEHNRHM